MFFAAVMSVWAVGLHRIWENKRWLPHGAWAARCLGSLSAGRRELLYFDCFCCFRVLLWREGLG